MKEPLTDVEQKALDFVVGYIEEKGYPPTVREVTAALGFTSSASGVRHIQALARKGYLVVEHGSRALRVVT